MLVEHIGHLVIRHLTVKVRNIGYYYRLNACIYFCTTLDINLFYHLLYYLLNFIWLTHLQITGVNIKSTVNNWCKQFTEHAHLFKMLSAANISLLMRSFHDFASLDKHGSYCRVL